MPKLSTALLILTIIVVLLPTETYAFGAGDIPDFGYLNDKAFRHGDIENILSNLAKTAGRVGGGGGFLGFASNVIKSASGGSKFSKSDIQKVYFGNWLRDYSQAMDIAGLTKLSADTLVLVVSVLGFMTFGFATEEFQVTPERLGVYLPVEHIDNPKGYAEKEGDARKFHPKLRPPVDPRELEIDERTGMKKYIATENQSWDTSTALIRRMFRACIDKGRRAHGEEGADLWEAYRLLGTGLHTMEDLLAHSNWCELTLRKMGHREVFCHVGDRVTVNTPNGQAPPLVTGTFGGADFLHSLMGEATDHLSQASVTDLSAKMNDASQNGNNNVSALQNILKKLPIGGGADKMGQAESIHAESKAYHFNPNDVAPPEVQQKLLTVLKWHDSVLRDVLKKLEMIPGLDSLLDTLTNALNAYVYTLLAPWLTPILQQATSVLGEGSKAVINSEDQYEVFNDPHASDPSHSLLSKDHFGLILNEPAGKIAQIVVQNTVKLIVNAWFDNNVNPDQVINEILEAFHHPYYATGRSRIQNEMFQGMQKWLDELNPTQAEETLNALTKESVRNGKNKRLGSEDESNIEPGYGSSMVPQVPMDSASRRSQPKVSRHEDSYGQSEEVSSRYSGNESYPTRRDNREEYSGYDRESSRDDESSYQSSNQNTGRKEYRPSGAKGHGTTYGRTGASYDTQERDENSYGTASHGRQGDRAHTRTGGLATSGYGGQEMSSGYGNEERSSGYTPSYVTEQRSSGHRAQEDSYSSQRELGYDEEQSSRSSYPGYGRQTQEYGHGNIGTEQQSSPYGPSYGVSGHQGQEYSHDNRTQVTQSGYRGEEQSSRYTSSYGALARRAPEYGSQTESGYGGEGRTGYTQERSSGYEGGGNGRDEESVQGYGYGRQERDSSGGGRGQKYDEDNSDSDKESSDEERERGHGGGYGAQGKGSKRRSDEDTFGAERLDIQGSGKGYGYQSRNTYEDSEY